MKKDFSRSYEDLEQLHWWFRARREILKSLLADHVGWRPAMKVLEVGTGPGENLYSLYPPSAEVAGIEPDPDNARKADARGPTPVYCGTLEDLPSEVVGCTFDVVCLFDVLEHIQDDGRALKRLWELLNEGGVIALSVPAYAWLWGLQDEVSHHYRRYTRRGLCRKLRLASFQVERSTYFNTFLFPVIALFRLGARFIRSHPNALSDFDYSGGLVDRVFFRVFRFEKTVLRGLNFPFGVSCFVIARKLTRPVPGVARADY